MAPGKDATASFTVKIPATLNDELERAAAIEGLPKTTVVRKAIERILQERELTFKIRPEESPPEILATGQPPGPRGPTPVGGTPVAVGKKRRGA